MRGCHLDRLVSWVKSQGPRRRPVLWRELLLRLSREPAVVVEDEHTVFLKTFIPSRKATKQYLGGEFDDEDGR
jgi:hypothetical protein